MSDFSYSGYAPGMPASANERAFFDHPANSGCPGMVREKGQKEFLDAEFFQLTLAAVTQRGRVYSSNLSEMARRPLHETLGGLLKELSPQ